MTNDTLSKCVTDIRKALGDNARQQRLLKTVSKSGYRFVGPVEEQIPQSAHTVVETEVTTIEVEIEETADERPATSSYAANSKMSRPQDCLHQRLEPRFARNVLGIALVMILVGVLRWLSDFALNSGFIC